MLCPRAQTTHCNQAAMPVPPPINPTASFLHIALSRQVWPTALKVALFVGTILALINHGPNALQGNLSAANLVQIALTYLVPYSVSTYSAVRVIQHRQPRLDSNADKSAH